MADANILAVMDNVLEADEIQGWINSWGYRVISSDSLQGEPGKIKREINPDLILIDRLLEKNDLFKGVQRIQEHLNIPVIYITSSFDKKTLENAKLTEAYVCLLKPVNPQELKFTIEMALYKHKMKRALEEKERKYRLLIENADDPIAVINYDGLFLLVNDSAAEYFGGKPDDFKGKKMWDLFPEKHAIHQMNAIRKVMDSKKGIVSQEKTIIQGKERWFSNNLQPIINSQGVASAVQLIARDITLHKNSEKALQERENFFSGTLNDMQTYIAVLKPQGEIIFVNNTTLEIIGRRLEDVQGRMFHEMEWWTYSEEARNSIHNAIGECANGKRLTKEIKCQTLQGLIWLDYRMHPIYNEKGKVKYLVAEGIDISHEKKTERALQREQNRFEVLADNAPFGMMLIDKKGTYKYINPKFKEIFGYDLEDIPNGKEWFRKAFPHSDERYNAISSWIKDFKSVGVGEKKPRTFEVTCKNGSKKLVNFIPVLLSSGEYVMTVEDITLRQRVEKAVQESEERFRTVAQSAVDAIIITDINGDIVFCNESLQRIFGYFEEEILEKPVKMLFAGRYQDDFQRMQYHFKLTGANFLSDKVFESYGLRKDGSEFPLEISITTWEVGGKQYTTLIIRDITERKLVDYELEKTEERFRQMADNIEEIFWIIDPHMSQILYISPSYKNLWGRSRESLYDNPRSWIESIHPEDRREVIKNIFRTSQEVQVASEEGLEYRIVRPDGTIRWIKAKSFPVINDKGEMHRIVGIAHDITRRKTAEEKYHNLTENINLGAYRSTADPQGRFIEVNNFLIKMLGYDKEELLALNVSDLYQNPEDREKFTEKMFERGYVKNEELMLKKKDGTFLLASISAVAVKDGKGEIKYFDGVVKNMILI
jgi:two-component system, sporulation sensor kinase E